MQDVNVAKKGNRKFIYGRTQILIGNEFMQELFCNLNEFHFLNFNTQSKLPIFYINSNSKNKLIAVIDKLFNTYKFKNCFKI